jgi:RNA polymerase sigma factor (sigma-70 family)
MDYKDQVRRVYKKLSREQQIELYEKMKSGDSQARDTLVSCCLPMVIKLAEQFSSNNKHIDFEDLVQEGNLALIKSVDVFNPYKSSITTLAWWAITNSLISATHKSNYKMKHPYSVSSYASKLMKEIDGVSSESNDPEYIANKLNRKVKTIKNMKSNMYNRTGMFSSSVTERQEMKQRVPDHFCLGYLIEILDDSDVVSNEDSEVFKQYYGLGGSKSKTSKEIANDYSMETNHVTDIIKRVRRDITLFVKERVKKDG